MDELIIALKNVSEQFLPILGAVALIFLCILLKKVWKLIDQLTLTVASIDPTIKLANQSIEKVQAPLDTVVKLSHTIDDARDKTVDSISKAAAYASENLDTLKEKVQEMRQPADAGTVIVDTYPQTEDNHVKEDGENV